MRILVVNKFLHHVGGVETYMDWQAANLERIGIETHFFGMEPPPGSQILPALRGNVTVTPNREFNGTKISAARSAFSSIYSPAAERKFLTAIERFKPDLVHFHSTCRQLTPSVARALTRRGLPGVLTAHEYKQVCATQRLWDDRRNRVCTACLSGNALSRMRNVAVRGCVRGSVAASMFAIPEIPIADHLWARSNVVIHAPSEFMGQMIASAPYIPNRVHVLDLPWGMPQPRTVTSGWENRALYLGRLEKEKGVDVLLDAWRFVEAEKPSAELIIAGGGSEQAALEEKARSLGLQKVRFIGRYERSVLAGLFGQVAVSVHPSRWFENSPYTVRESLLFGVPAIVAAVGGMPEMIGVHSGSAVPPDNPVALGTAILDELRQPRAGSPSLTAAVANRAMSDDDHLEGLEVLYRAAGTYAT